MDAETKRLVEPWKYHQGPLPDFDHPLACVFDAGVQYAVELLAKQLKVETYDICDGTEEYDGDLGGTLQNIVNAALPLNADGDRMWPSEVAATITRLTAERDEARARAERAEGALQPFVTAFDVSEYDDVRDETRISMTLCQYGEELTDTPTMGDFRKARAALTQQEPKS